MPFVERRNGAVVGLYLNPQPGYAEEYLADDHADVESYKNPIPTESELMAKFAAAIEQHIEDVAKEREYSSALSCVSYLNSKNDKWRLEAQAFSDWRDLVWVYAIAEMEKVLAKEREMPTIEQIITELPTMIWPE